MADSRSRLGRSCNLPEGSYAAREESRRVNSYQGWEENRIAIHNYVNTKTRKKILLSSSNKKYRQMNIAI